MYQSTQKWYIYDVSQNYFTRALGILKRTGKFYSYRLLYDQRSWSNTSNFKTEEDNGHTETLPGNETQTKEWTFCH